MQELRFVAVSEDGSYAVLAVPGRSGRYILPIDERLRAVALGQTSRLAQYEIEVESPLRPKEIQARIRAGETAEEIADAAGIPVERVRWFEGPVLAERAYIADQAQAGSVRRAGGSSGPGPRLGDIVTARLSAAGTDPADGQWDSRKRGDGNWQVSLTFPSGGRLHVAEWVFDPRRRHVMPDDDNAARLSLPESELPAEPVPVPGEATVTPIAPRLGAAAGMGGGSVGGHPGGPGMSRFRPERSVIPDRSLGLDRSLVERPAPPAVPAAERTAMADRSAVSDRSSVSDRFAATERPAPSTSGPPRSAQQDRAGYQGRPANPGYAEFPESAPYRAPEPAADIPSAAQVPAAQVPPAPATEDSERVRLTPPRPVIFEDPEPTFLEQSEPARDHAAAQPTAAPATATEPMPISRAESPATADREAAAPAAEQASATAAAPVAAKPAGLNDVPAQPATGAPAPVAPAPAAEAAVAVTPGPAAAKQAETGKAKQAETGKPEPAAAQAEPAAAAAQAATAESAAPATPAPAAEVPAPAEPAPAEEPPARPRPGSKKNAKARRSSVPSWDEIMLGSSRQRD